MDQQQRMVGDLSCTVVGDASGSDVILLHGWACDQTFLEEQVTFFAKEARVIALDLPGFGNSAAMTEPTVPRMAQRVLDALGELGSIDAIFIGHSMGGVIGLELSRRAPGVVGRLAMIDTVLWPRSEVAGAISGASRLLHDGRFEEALNASKAALILPSDSVSAAERFERAYKAADPDGLVASFDAHLIDYDPDPAVAALSCPIAHIATDSALTSLEDVMARVKGLRVGKIIGSGHFAPLLVPQQINALLSGFLSVTARSSR